jgi:hypothetical protein
MAVRANCQRDKSTRVSVGRANIDRLLFACKYAENSVYHLEPKKLIDPIVA